MIEKNGRHERTRTADPYRVNDQKRLDPTNFPTNPHNFPHNSSWISKLTSPLLKDQRWDRGLNLMFVKKKGVQSLRQDKIELSPGAGVLAGPIGQTWFLDLFLLITASSDICVPRTVSKESHSIRWRLNLTTNLTSWSSARLLQHDWQPHTPLAVTSLGPSVES